MCKANNCTPNLVIIVINIINSSFDSDDRGDKFIARNPLLNILLTHVYQE